MEKHDLPQVDLEKSTHATTLPYDAFSPEKSSPLFDPPVEPSVPVPGRLTQLNARIESLAGLEARGIARVPPEERHGCSVMGYMQMALLWFSINLTANNLAIGLLGPLVFDLGFVESEMMAIWGALLGSAGTAYMSIWGAQSGNRTMV